MKRGFVLGSRVCVRACVCLHGDVLSGASPVDGQWIGFSFLIVLCAFSIWSCEKGYRRSSAAVHGEELGRTCDNNVRVSVKLRYLRSQCLVTR